jgi:hypothetical protein
MRNLKNWVVGSALLLGVMPGAFAQESLADRFPSDAILYVQADTNKLVDGALSLDLVKLLDEPQVQEFLKPVAAELPVKLSTAGLRQMIDSVPWRKYVDGRVELALRGLRVTVGDQSFAISASQTIDAKQLNRLVAIAGQYAERAEAGGEAMTVQVEPDFVLSLDAGDEFQQFFDGALRMHHATSEPVKVGGREGRRLSLAMNPHGGDGPSVVLHVVQDGRRWWIGSGASIEQCMKGGGQESLARSRAFQSFKRQVSSGDPAVMTYVNVANAAHIFEKLIPPIVKEELDLFGVSSIEAFGLASSYVEGGVRDTMALTYSAPPTGLVSLLDCTDGGFQFLKRAPAETGFYFGARIDAEAFVDKLAKVCDELFPGSSRHLERGLAEANRALGLDLRQEILPAFGNEIGVYLTSPGAGSLFPDGMVMLKIGDREQFEKLLARALGEAAKEGVQASEIKSLPEGTRGWTIQIPDSPVQPAIATTSEMFCVSANVLKLKESLRGTKGTQQCALDNPNLQRVLKGLTGAPNADGLSLLGFIDLGKLVEVGYQFAPMAASQLQQNGVELDMSALPETEVITRHFSGIGIGGRSDAKGLALTFFTPAGILTGSACAAPWFALMRQHEYQAAAMETTPTELPAPHKRDAAPAPAPAKKAEGKTRPLSELFANIEKATGATVDFPAELGDVKVAYTPRSGKLETILEELAKLAGFDYRIQDVDGEKLVTVTQR